MDPVLGVAPKASMKSIWLQTWRSSGIRTLPWIMIVGLCALLIWALVDRAALVHRADRAEANIELIQVELEDTSLATLQAERQRGFAEDYLDNLLSSNDELKRVYLAEKAASDEAIAQSVEARRQTRAKEVALENEQAARGEEKQARLLADARADSIAVEKRRTDKANRRLQASKLAQNSMALKGEPQRRGLMAVYALRAMEEADGDVHRDEILRALQGALEELERSAPPGLTKLGAGLRTIHKHVENIFRKLGCETRAAAAVTALDVMRGGR